MTVQILTYCNKCTPKQHIFGQACSTGAKKLGDANHLEVFLKREGEVFNRIGYFI